MTESTRRQALQHYRQPAADAHAGLWLDKFICNQGEKAFCPDDKDKKDRKEPKKRLVGEVAAIPEPKTYQPFYERWQKTLERVCLVKPRLATVQGRMVLGLGAEGVLETAVALHRTYGTPMIPGSALKGLAASYARQVLGWETADEAYQIIFGKVGSDVDNDFHAAGYLTFFDALYKPKSGWDADGKGHRALHADVLTVHHQAYYRGDNAAPADWDSPVPVPMLSATGQYLMALTAPPGGEQWVKRTFELLGQALKHKGIGAKTSSGYGRMTLAHTA